MSSIVQLDRADHVWYEIKGGADDGKHKCCLCGAVTDSPPFYPTPSTWTPNHYDLPLTEPERRMCGNPATKGKL